MKDTDFRQAYAFVLLGATFIWAGFVVFMTHHALDTGATGDWLASSGSTGLLGALIAWNADIKQFWFRKSRTTDDNGKKN